MNLDNTVFVKIRKKQWPHMFDSEDKKRSEKANPHRHKHRRVVGRGSHRSVYLLGTRFSLRMTKVFGMRQIWWHAPNCKNATFMLLKNTARSRVAFLSHPSVNMEKEAWRYELTQWQLKIIELPRSHSPDVAEPG